MVFNYIVKSTSGIEINSRGEIFEKVEKASLTYPQDADLSIMNTYKKIFLLLF